jgi:hypothetical protein
VMPIAAGRVSDLGDVVFACRHVVSLVRKNAGQTLTREQRGAM